MYDELYDSILSGKYLRPVGEEIKPEWPVMVYTTSFGNDEYFIIKKIDDGSHNDSLYLIGVDFRRVKDGKFDYDMNDYNILDYRTCRGLHYLGNFIRCRGKTMQDFINEITPLVANFNNEMAIEKLD
jgi:hypothetical protein